MTQHDPLSESAIVRTLADEVCQRFTRKVVAQLRSMKGGLSGEDSGLLTFWDEVCAQVQYEQSPFWDMYEETTRSISEAFVKEMPAWHREAVWLQTDAGIGWRSDDVETREQYPVNHHDIVEYLLDSYIWIEAGRWTNKRIRAYIDQAADSD